MTINISERLAVSEEPRLATGSSTYQGLTPAERADEIERLAAEAGEHWRWSDPWFSRRYFTKYDQRHPVHRKCTCGRLLAEHPGAPETFDGWLFGAPSCRTRFESLVQPCGCCAWGEPCDCPPRVKYLDPNPNSRPATWTVVAR